MYLKFYLLAIVKIGLLITLPPFLAGLAAGLFKRDRAEKSARYLGAGFVLLIEAIVLVQKGAPFFFANLYVMFSLSPVIWLQYLIGVGGFILWVIFAIGYVNKGIAFSDRLRNFRNNPA